MSRGKNLWKHLRGLSVKDFKPNGNAHEMQSALLNMSPKTHALVADFLHHAAGKSKMDGAFWGHHAVKAADEFLKKSKVPQKKWKAAAEASDQHSDTSERASPSLGAAGRLAAVGAAS